MNFNAAQFTPSGSQPKSASNSPTPSKPASPTNRSPGSTPPGNTNNFTLPTHGQHTMPPILTPQSLRNMTSTPLHTMPPLPLMMQMPHMPSANSLPMPLPPILTPNDAIKHLTSSSLPTPRALQNMKSHSSTNLREDSLKAQLSAKTQKMEMIQKSYWSLKAEFDAVCDSIKTMKAAQAKNGKAGALPMINEEGTDELVLRLAQKEQELEAAKQANQEQRRKMQTLRKNHQKAAELLKKKTKDSNKKNNALEKDVKNLKHKVKRLEKENKKLTALKHQHMAHTQRKDARQDVLSELYLASSQIRAFMESIGQYGAQFEALKAKQMQLMEAYQRKDGLMGEIYNDIERVEASYGRIYGSLDALANASQEKEVTLMSKNREYITLLEQEKTVSASHLEEYVKENQKLHSELADREMKLRQTQNKFYRANQRCQRLMDEQRQFQQGMNYSNSFNSIWNSHAQGVSHMGMPSHSMNMQGVNMGMAGMGPHSMNPSPAPQVFAQ